MEAELSIRGQVLNRIRSFNREYFNPFAMSFAGRSGDYWSVVQHTGRRSGKRYTTPVIASLQDSSAIIPLPYSRNTDWAKNVMATGGCTLIHQGKVYTARQPEIITIAEGGLAFSGTVHDMLERWGTQSCVRFGELSEAQDGEAIYQAFVQANPRERGLWVLATAVFLLVGIVILLRPRKK